MMNKLRSILDLKFKSISHFFIQALLFSVLAITAPQVFAVTMDKNFDHYNTNFPLDGAHKRTSCDSCHKRGIFKGTPNTCESCHGSNSTIANSTMSTRHVRVTGTCDTCHTVKTWQQVRMDHSAVSGTCKSCHGTIKGITPKNTGHIITNSDCGTCHTTRAWSPAGFDHGPETTNCVRCHNGSVALGKNPTHIPLLLNECDACHKNFRSFKGNIKKPMPHDGYVATGSTDCVSCHDGRISFGLSPNHVPLIINNECGACHSTRGFTDIKSPMPHDGFLSSDCRLCHNGQVPSAGSMLNAPRVAGHSHVSVASIDNCSLCHKSGFVTWDKGTNKAVPPSRKKDHDGHFLNPQGCNNSGCHNAPANHALSIETVAIKNSCSDCHSTFPAIMIHDAARQGQCKVCHTNSGNGSKNGSKVTPSHNQFMNNASSSACDSCHMTPSARKASIGDFNKYLPSMDHIAFSLTKCGYCHTPNQVKASAPTVTLISEHSLITSNNSCGTCHNISGRFSNNLIKGATHDNTQTTQCNKCHVQGLTIPNAGNKLSNAHKAFATSVDNCISCHGNLSRWRDGFLHSIPKHNICHSCHERGGPRYPETGQEREPLDHEAPNQSSCTGNSSCHGVGQGAQAIIGVKWD